MMCTRDVYLRSPYLFTTIVNVIRAMFKESTKGNFILKIQVKHI